MVFHNDSVLQQLSTQYPVTQYSVQQLRLSTIHFEIEYCIPNVQFTYDLNDTLFIVSSLMISIKSDKRGTSVNHVSYLQQ